MKPQKDEMAWRRGMIGEEGWFEIYMMKRTGIESTEYIWIKSTMSTKLIEIQYQSKYTSEITWWMIETTIWEASIKNGYKFQSEQSFKPTVVCSRFETWNSGEIFCLTDFSRLYTWRLAAW